MAYAAPPVPADGLGVAAAVMLGCMVLVSVFVTLVAFNDYTVLDDALNGHTSHTLDEITDADDFRGLSLGIFGLGEVATGVVFICWQYRHSRNAEALAGPGGLGSTFAIVGWIIPLGWYVLPGIEIHQSAKAASPPVPGGGPRSGPGSGPAIPWILLFSAGWVGLTVSLFMHPGSLDTKEDFEHARDAALAGTLGGVALVLAGLLGAVMVQSLTKRQSQRIRQVVPAAFVPWVPVAAPQPGGAWRPPAAAPSWSQPPPPPPGYPPGPPGPWQPLQ
ncbi:MAG TPA: DUF4328 domain-containing protein [Acidimicrobiales bacterium]|jgi:hypothetical protein